MIELYCVSSSVPLVVRFGQLLRYADKRIINIMKMYIKRNNLQRRSQDFGLGGPPGRCHWVDFACSPELHQIRWGGGR